MRYAALLVLIVVLVACGGAAGPEPLTTEMVDVPDPPAADAMDEWGRDAEAWWQGFVESSEHGPWHVVPFLASDLLWNERTSGVRLVGEESWVRYQESLVPTALPWSGVAVMRDLDRPILVSADELLVRYRFDHEFPIHFLDRMTIGPEGVSEWVSAGSLASARHYEQDGIDAGGADQLVDDYLALWNGSSDIAVQDVYAPGATITDSLLGVSLTGTEEIEAGSRASGGRMTLLDLPDDATPAVYVGGYERDPDPREVRFLVDVDDGTGCPGSIGVGLAYDDHGVIGERRYHAVQSVRSCYRPDELESGWWIGRAIPEEMVLEHTSTLTHGDLQIEVFNGTPGLEGLLRWGLERYEEAGLATPRVASVRFLRSTAVCSELSGSAGGGVDGAVITICATPGDVCEDDGCRAWRRWYRHIWLHELAHPWLDEHVGGPLRGRFLEVVGLERWSDPQDPWNRRGVERAANTIAFGLMDEPVGLTHDFEGTCEQRDEGFSLLTGTEPIAPCTDPG